MPRSSYPGSSASRRWSWSPAAHLVDRGEAALEAAPRRAQVEPPDADALWARRLDENLDEAIRLAGPERVRVWRLYLRAARNGFESSFTSIYQVLANRA